MNLDTIAGEGTQMKGQFKQDVGTMTGDQSLRSSGMTDQLSGGLRKGVGQFRDFARRNPAATYTAAGILGLALLNSLRGRSGSPSTRRTRRA